MNIVQLTAFVAVVDYGSFSEAARVLDFSQPAVTMQIQALEADLGVTLLDRRYRRTDITEAGQTLLPYARAVLATLDDARAALDELSDRVTGRLLVSASTTPGQYVLPRLLGEFVRKYPEVGVQLAVHDTAEVVAAVESGDATFGMTGARIASKASFEQLGSDSLVLIAPPDHAARDAVSLSLRDLADQPFIMRESGSGTRSVFETTLSGVGIDANELHAITELGTNEAIVNAVEGGMGLGVVSRWAADKAIKLGTVVELAVEGFPVVRPFFLVTSKTTPTRASAAFIEHLRANLG